MFIKEYKVEQKELLHPFGHLIYRKVTPIKGEESDWMDAPNRCFLYEDYVTTMVYPEVFHHILLLEIDEKYRNNGYGKLLVQQFFEEAKPKSVILEVGITKQELYEKLVEEKHLYNYLETSIKLFWEKMGFTDINHTAVNKQETIPMLWPPERAKRIILQSKTNLF